MHLQVEFGDHDASKGQREEDEWGKEPEDLHCN